MKLSTQMQLCTRCRKIGVDTQENAGNGLTSTTTMRTQGASLNDNIIGSSADRATSRPPRRYVISEWRWGRKDPCGAYVTSLHYSAAPPPNTQCQLQFLVNCNSRPEVGRQGYGSLLHRRHYVLLSDSPQHEKSKRPSKLWFLETVARALTRTDASSPCFR